MNRIDLETKEYLQRRKIVSAASFAILLLFFAFICVTVGKPLVSLASNPEAFRNWVEAQGIWGRVMMMGIMCLQVVVAIIPGEAIEVGAGYAFGAWEGLALCLAGAAVGSCLIFLFTKKLGVKMVEAFISREKLDSLSFIHNSQKRNLLVFLLFFLPGTPKDVLTYFVGLTPMRIRDFLLITTVARIPSVLTSTIGGNALGLSDYTFALGMFAFTGLISLCGLLTYRWISKRKAGK